MLPSMAESKSPGTDGLLVDFYNTFWDDIGHLVVDSFNYAFDRGHMADAQGRAVVSLVPKPGKDFRYLNNWHPI